MALLDVRGLTRHFPIRRNPFARMFGLGRDSIIKAVENLSFQVEPGEIFGIVGESGCGKSTICSLLAKLDSPTNGQILFRDRDINMLTAAQLRQFRRDVQIIFQDPFDSLNPRFRVFDLVAEAPRALSLGSEADIRQSVHRMLELVGLRPSDYAERYPHQMSGGERQRVGIASALIVGPALVIADEPISMLDVSIRVSVLDLLRDLSRRLNFACVYVSHDLSILTNICNRVMVMYLGQLVEIGRAVDIVQRPQHPYTQALVAAVPVPDPTYRRPPIRIKGDLARPIDPPPGCRFAPRCLYALDVCGRDVPDLRPFGAAQSAACHVAPISLPLDDAARPCAGSAM
ncbi:MAG: ABC transporter ATP-binding protein [Dongiaceae bacterium]